MQGSDIYTCCLFYFSYRLYHHLCFKLRKQRLWPYVTCSRSHKQTAELGYTCGQTVALIVLSSVTLGKQHLPCSVVDVRWCMWGLEFNVRHEATALHMSCIPMQAVFLSGSALLFPHPHQVALLYSSVFFKLSSYPWPFYLNIRQAAQTCVFVTDLCILLSKSSPCSQPSSLYNWHCHPQLPSLHTSGASLTASW